MHPPEARLLGAVARVGESTGGFPTVCMHRLCALALAGDASLRSNVEIFDPLLLSSAS